MYRATVTAFAFQAGLATTVYLPADSPGAASPAVLASCPPGLARADTGVRLVDGSYDDAVAASKRDADRAGAHDGNVVGPDGNHGHWPLAAFLKTLLSTLPTAPAAIWLPFGDICIGVDAAMRLLEWPTTLAAARSDLPHVVPVQAPPMRPDAPAAWPVSPLYDLLPARAGDNLIHHVDAEVMERAQLMLDSAGLTTTPGGALGLAGLLDTRSSSTSDDLVLVAESSAPHTQFPATRPRTESR